MEGVVVSAKKAGSTITVSVISRRRRQFNFPAGKLETGPYTLKIRAIGYELDGPKAVDLATDRPGCDKLRKTRNLAAQLTSGEWVMSVQAPEQKAFLDRCTSCHIERPVKSTFDAEQFIPVLQRMGAMRPGRRRSSPGGAATSAPTSARSGCPRADYLASINLSQGAHGTRAEEVPRLRAVRHASSSPNTTSAADHDAA